MLGEGPPQLWAAQPTEVADPHSGAVQQRSQRLELSPRGGDAQFDTGDRGQAAQVCGAGLGGQQLVGDAPWDVGDLTAVDRGDLEQEVGHRSGGHHDGVGGSCRLTQDLHLVAVRPGADQVGAVDEGDPRVRGQGPDQGRGGAECEVLQVHNADSGRVECGREDPAQGEDVAAEGRDVRHSPATDSGSSPPGRRRRGLAGASMKARAGMRGRSPV